MNTIFSASHSSLEGLVKDLKTVVADADELLNEVSNYTAEEYGTARLMIEGRLSEARSRLGIARSVVSKRAREAVDGTQEYVTENPWKVLGVAVAAGVIICAFISRR